MSTNNTIYAMQSHSVFVLIDMHIYVIRVQRGHSFLQFNQLQAHLIQSMCLKKKTVFIHHLS